MAKEKYGSNNFPTGNVATASVGTVNVSADKAASGGGSDLGKVTAVQQKKNRRRTSQEISMPEPLKMHLIHDHEFDIIIKRDNDYGLRDPLLGASAGGGIPTVRSIYELIFGGGVNSLDIIDFIVIFGTFLCLGIGSYIWYTRRNQENDGQKLIDKIRARKTKKLNLEDII